MFRWKSLCWVINKSTRHVRWQYVTSCVRQQSRSVMVQAIVRSVHLRTEFLGIARWQKASTLVPSESHHCFLKMMWFCWFYEVGISCSHWSSSPVDLCPYPHLWSQAVDASGRNESILNYCVNAARDITTNLNCELVEGLLYSHP